MEAQKQARASTGRTDSISGLAGCVTPPAPSASAGLRVRLPGTRHETRHWDLVATPTEREYEDPSLLVGRAGYSRPRHPAEGSRPITRYEQRSIDQWNMSPHGANMARSRERRSALRGRIQRARPIPPDLRARWLGGWLTPVLPEHLPDPVLPSLDPFFGAGIGPSVATQRDWTSCELSEYAKPHRARSRAATAGRSQTRSRRPPVSFRCSTLDAARWLG